MGSTVTIMDVAKACGLSKSAVAYALGGNVAGKVSAKNMEIVTKTARKLGYRPNLAARTLSSKKSNTIGVMMFSPETHFYASLSMELQRILAEKGYIPFFAYWEKMTDLPRVNEAYSSLLSRGVDGIITCELEGLALHRDVPTVVYGRELKDFDSVMFDEMAGFSKLGALLASEGRRKVAYIGIGSREEACREGLRKAGLDIDRRLVFHGAGQKDGRDGVRKFLSSRSVPDAIVCGNDEMALAAMSEALRAGRRVPEEIAFTGCDNIEFASFFHPSLTTLGRSPKDVAGSLVGMLLRRLAEPERAVESTILEPELIVRESTGRARS